MRLTRETEADLVRTLRRDPAACLTFTPDTYTRPDGALTVHRGGTQELLHRRLYRTLIGEIGRRRLERSCSTYGCCNPHHYQTIHRRPARATNPAPEATSDEVATRRRGVAATNAAKLYCPALHEYSPENTYTYVDKTGARRRKCRACNREARRRRAAFGD